MAKRLAVLFVASVALWGCGEDEINKVRPEITVSVCKPDGCTLHFGDVPVFTTDSKEIILVAASRIEVRVHTLTVTGPDAPFFSLPPALVAEVAAGQGAVPSESSLSVDVAFRPTEERDYVATLVIESDDPDEADKHREVALFGVGKSPNISVEPAAFVNADGVTEEISAIRCPEGRTYPRCTTAKTLRIINTGDVELEITKVSWVEVTPGILAGNPPAPSGLRFLGSTSASTIRERNSVNVGLEFRAVAATPAEYDVKIRIESNDPDSPVLEVPVHVRIVPNSPPTVCAKTQKVWRGEYDAQGHWGFSGDIGPGALGYGDPFEPVVRAGYQVFVYDGGTDSGAACKTEDPDGDDISIQWTVTPLSGQPAPVVNGAINQNMRFEVPALGDYEVKVEAWDTLHQTAHTVDTMIVHAAPKDDITVVIDWRGTAPRVFDLDLHLVKMDSGSDSLVDRLWCNDDTYFFNRQPDWGPLGSLGNPVLNLDGQGLDALTRAENTTLEVAEPGEYWVVINYFKDGNVLTGGAQGYDAPKDQVKLYLFTSSPAGPVRWPADTTSFYTPLRDLKYPGSLTGCVGGTCLDFWVAAKIVWPGVGGNVIVTAANQFLPSGEAYPGDLAVQSCVQ